jgi:hypothetical protein
MDTSKPTTPRIPTYAIDDVALSALRIRCEELGGERPVCDLCEQPIEGRAAASGLLLWARGDEIRCDEPPLCPSCAAAISVAALAGGPGDDGEGDEE